MSWHRKPVVSVLAVAALAALSLGATAHLEAPAHHQEARHAVLVTYVAPAPLDEMTVTAVTRLTSERAILARAEARVRAEARREHESVLLAYREHVLAVQAARARAAVAVPAHVAAVIPAVSEAVYSFAGIEGLWLAAGGNPAYAATAGCIAEHESGGRANAISPTDDFGVFQIHADPAALNPQTSTEAAVRMSSDGTNWSAWTTSGYC